MIIEFLAFTVGMVLVLGGLFACAAKIAFFGKCKSRVASRMREDRFYEVLQIEAEKEEQKNSTDYRKVTTQVPSMSHS